MIRVLYTIGMTLFAASGLLANTPALATDQTPQSCRSFINKNALMRERDKVNQDSSDPTVPWYGVPNDDPYQHLDGSWIENIGQLNEWMASSRADLVIIYNAHFAGWDFTRLKTGTAGLCFYRADLSNSRWDGLDLSRSAFVQSSLKGASMKGTRLDRVLFDNVSLQSADMRYASLTYGVLSGAWSFDLSQVTGQPDTETGLNGWDLAHADLSAFSFDCGIEIHNGCPLDRRIILTGANLAYTDLRAFPGWGEFLTSGALVDHTRIAPDQLVYFSDATFAGPVIMAGRSRHSFVDGLEIHDLLRQFDEAARRAEMASFDCNSAISRVEQMICSEEGGQFGLKREDQLLSVAYRLARKADTTTMRSQAEWIDRRNRCDDYECILSHYVGRTQTLLGIAGQPHWISPEQSVLFIGGQPDVLVQNKRSGAWRQLVPVLVDAADELVLVTHGRDGRWSIRGQSTGANAHVCIIDASGLRFDRTNGWFVSDPGDGTAPTPVFRIIGEELFVLANGHPDRDEYPDSDFVSCGARASFSASRHVELNEEELAHAQSRMKAF